jgi:hypothetical protein
MSTIDKLNKMVDGKKHWFQSNKEVNGWTNYVTFATYTWLSNEESGYNELVNMASQYTRCIDTNDYEAMRDALYDLESDIKDYIEAMQNDDTSGMFTDLLGYAIELVNCEEIALAFIEHSIE